MLRGLGPSGFPPLALATAQCSGKENVHLHPKWLPHLKPSLSQGLPPEPGSQELWGSTGGGRSKPHPAGSVWGREPRPPGPPSQLLEDGGRRQVAQGQGRATERGGGGPTGDALVSGSGRKPQDEPAEKWERETKSHRHHAPTLRAQVRSPGCAMHVTAEASSRADVGGATKQLSWPWISGAPHHPRSQNKVNTRSDTFYPHLKASLCHTSVPEHIKNTTA